MGDNVFLGDRNGVRTPMQWSGDRRRLLRADSPGCTCRRSWTPSTATGVNVEAQLRTQLRS